jgi:CPA2 family monovalent cation:H+ antiporter-2/glutathione-regulated potassium-efflux system protein KefB
MGRAALTELGTSEEAIDRAETMFRNRDKERLKIQIETQDVSAARDRIIVQPERAAR